MEVYIRHQKRDCGLTIMEGATHRLSVIPHMVLPPSTVYYCVLLTAPYETLFARMKSTLRSQVGERFAVAIWCSMS